MCFSANKRNICFTVKSSEALSSEEDNENHSGPYQLEITVAFLPAEHWEMCLDYMYHGCMCVNYLFMVFAHFFSGGIVFLN